ncbi:PCRF domain-containing protein [Actinomadura sp. KC345]|nr:PCRF domain-containing protein [Actinomadura sp. KC345]
MCVVEIRPGEGGADALAFATELAAAIAAWAARRGWPVDRSAAEPGRTIVMTLAGVAEADLAWLSGTHRLQHEPRNDRRGRRHTSTATVAVMPGRPVPASRSSATRTCAYRPCGDEDAAASARTRWRPPSGSTTCPPASSSPGPRAGPRAPISPRPAPTWRTGSGSSPRGRPGRTPITCAETRSGRAIGQDLHPQRPARAGRRPRHRPPVVTAGLAPRPPRPVTAPSDRERPSPWFCGLSQVLPMKIAEGEAYQSGGNDAVQAGGP